MIDTLVVITPKDFQRLIPLYPRLMDNIKFGNVFFVGAEGIEEIINNSAGKLAKAGYVDENSLIPFDEVHLVMQKKLKNILAGRELPRGITGWYYQQFLKMQYSVSCPNEYYMVWDGDTIPCREVNMFHEESGKPYFDLKHEHHPEYFETMGTILPGFHKVIGKSFISEHMLIKAEYMRELITAIESNSEIEGSITK